MGWEGWMGTQRHSDGSVSPPSVSRCRVMVLGGVSRERNLLWGSKGGRGAGGVHRMRQKG